MPVSEFEFISPASGVLTAALRTPHIDARALQGRGGDTPLLLVLGGQRRDQLEVWPHCAAAEEWEDAGCSSVGLDLPNHGPPRVDDRGEGIDGWVAAFMAGDDPFERAIADCRALIDLCIERGHGGAGGVFVYGVSRGGYVGLRLAAAEPRVHAVAAMAPCTDWRPTRWWADVASDASVAALSITNFALSVSKVGAVYLVIGNHDDGVHTPSCVALASAIMELEGPTTKGLASRLELHVVETEGHTVPSSWRREGGAWLLKQYQAAGSSGVAKL
jgi:pimeloyl-ACP methyl ester carboxylesterase